jgi:hypothetical protein
VLVKAPGGAQIPFGQVAEITQAPGPSMIRDENGQLGGYVYVDTATSDIGARIVQDRAEQPRATLGFVRVRRVAIAVIVAICISAPIAEMFDQWDHTYQDGSDTELNLVVIALCVGVGLSVASGMILLSRPRLSKSGSYLPPSGPLRLSPAGIARPIATSSSPPTPLRV